MILKIAPHAAARRLDHLPTNAPFTRGSHKTPRRLLRATLAIWLSICGLGVCQDRPNIVFILADDLGWSDLGCYGNEFHETPHIDGLAHHGVRFTSAYAAASVCSPTRASIMTGKYPARLHMTIWHEASQNPPQDRKLVPPKTVGNLPHEQITIAELLKPRGYFTAHVGKWHLGRASHYPETQGFDINIGGTFWGAPSTFFYPYRGLWSRSSEFRYVPGLPWGKEGEYLTDRLTDEAIATIQRVKDRPFFLHLAYHTVHTPIEGKPELVDYYVAKSRKRKSRRNPTYAAMVHSLDENVGRLLATLDELAIADRTLVFFTSDNGGYINPYRGVPVTTNRPLRSGKGSLYEGGIRIPLIVRWPGLAGPGAIHRGVVMSTDFYPTLEELTNTERTAEGAARVDGTSLIPVLREPELTPTREAVYWHYPHYYPTTTPVSAIREGQWKLLEYLEDGNIELYDLQNDLGESDDLSQSMPEKASALLYKLRQWRTDVDAQMPTLNVRDGTVERQ